MKTQKKVWWCILLERATSDVCAQFHLNLAMRAGSRDGYVRLAIPYGRTDAIRNLAARKFMSLSTNPDDTLVMLDQDHAHPHDIIERLVATDAMVVGALAFQRGEPFGPCMYSKTDAGQLRQAARWDAGGLYPVAAIGHAAIAIQRQAFETIWRAGSQYPWWRYLYPHTADLVEWEGKLQVEPERDPITLPSEDIYFSRQCTDAGVQIYCDTSIICPHKIDGGWVDETSWRDWLADHPDMETESLLVPEVTPEELAKLNAVQAAAPSRDVSEPNTRRAEVDIIIPGWNNFHHTRACIESLAQTSGVYFSVTYVDNGSDYLALDAFKRDYPGVTVISLGTNVGFVQAINAGMSRAIANGAPYMLWLNNDVKVPDGDPSWLQRLLAGFKDEHVGAVGAVSDNVYGWQRRSVGAAAGLTEAPVLIGFALAVRRQAAMQVGSLDVNYGIGNYEDWDYSIRLRKAGWKLLIAEDVWLHHAMHATFREVRVDFEQLLANNRRYFTGKWGAEVLQQMGVAETIPSRQLAGGPIGPVSSSAEESAAHKDSAPGVHLVTHATVGWLDRIKPYLDSLTAHSPWPAHLLIVQNGAGPAPAFHHSDSVKVRIVPDQDGAPEGTHSLQHGAFLPFVPGNPNDVLVYTDGDVRMQRDPNAAERALIEALPADVVAMGYNSGPHETLALEATRLQPRSSDLAQVWDPAILARAGCYNIGVIGARRSTWQKILKDYLTLYPAAVRSLNHRARQQWLVCYVVAKLGLAVQVLPYTFHMHGCYPLPAGGQSGAMATYEEKIVLFRHNIP